MCQEEEPKTKNQKRDQGMLCEFTRNENREEK